MSISSGRADIRALLSVLTRAAEDAMDEYDKALVPIPSLGTLATSDCEQTPQDFGPLALRKAIRVLEGACEQLRTTLAPPGHVLVTRMLNFEPHAMDIVIKFKIADALLFHPHGLHVDEISKQVYLSAERLSRVLRMLATKHCFVEVSENIFANNRLSLALVSTTGEASLLQFMSSAGHASAGLLTKVWREPGWADSYDSTRSALAYRYKDELHENGALFDWMKLHPDIRQLFDDGMIGFGKASGLLASIEAYPWENLPSGSTICDVGGGFGAFALPLLNAYPHLKVTLQDLPDTIEHVKKVWQEDNSSLYKEGKISFVSVDFMKEAPVANQDIYYLRLIIHQWADAEALVVLKNVRKAMAPHSRVLVHDFVLKPACPLADWTKQPGLDASPAPLLSNFGAGTLQGYGLDFNMMILTNGKERTVAEIRHLGELAGLEIVKIWDLAALDMVEFKIADAELL